jgi:hypothetical protein
MPVKNLIVAPFGCSINYQMSMDTSSKNFKFLNPSNENHRVMVSGVMSFAPSPVHFINYETPNPPPP